GEAGAGRQVIGVRLGDGVAVGLVVALVAGAVAGVVEHLGRADGDVEARAIAAQDVLDDGQFRPLRVRDRAALRFVVLDVDVAARVARAAEADIPLRRADRRRAVTERLGDDVRAGRDCERARTGSRRIRAGRVVDLRGAVDLHVERV